MLARFTAVAALVLPLLVVAQDCATGPVQCCNELATADSPAGAAALLSLVDVVVQDVTAQVGLGCTAVNVIGVTSGNSCDAHPVCCETNDILSGVSVGCIPVELS
ncbi:hypothetical protein BN946_scf184851.g103 [Trametes cinnabarina]|uniref:Hydrophobin n=1 Tax=Pycnoporus cinnabarinus TaxID=5643 RepID=A0A060S5T3_PYCCI|nr:hypothetical protein BN946_scf184851.g103 [Trametes cinnabarina]